MQNKIFASQTSPNTVAGVLEPPSHILCQYVVSRKTKAKGTDEKDVCHLQFGLFHKFFVCIAVRDKYGKRFQSYT